MIEVTEIFRSIQGESGFAGLPFLFVRLTGCNLRCHYCDTTYAYENGHTMSIEQVLGQIEHSRLKHVLVTGGEPLAQTDTPQLVQAIIDKGFTVVVETNGSLDIGVLPTGAIRIMDLKCPSSGHEADNRLENIPLLTPDDQVKFVIKDANDYMWAKTMVDAHQLPDRCTVLLSPLFGVIDPAELSSWIIQDELPVRLNMQLHKIIWPNVSRGV
jgi:7-carboxy-7-deazaguanine synthase